MLKGRRDVSADFGVAAGGDIHARNITIGVPPEQIEALVRDRMKPLQELADTQKTLLGLLHQRLDLNERQLRAALDAAGETDVPPERLAQKLTEIASRYKDLLQQTQAAPGDDPCIVELKTLVHRALTAGNLEDADTLLATIEETQAAALDRLVLDAAATRAQRGAVAFTRLHYHEAAGHFAAAAARVPDSYDEIRDQYRLHQAEALYHQGYEKGDNAALAQAVALCRNLLKAWPRERAPRGWAAIQSNLGIALMRLGERTGRTDLIKKAVRAHREALKERTRERAPLDWAMTQTNLDSTLRILGEGEPGTAHLTQAVAACREALKVYTRERAPLERAAAQHNLGLAVMSLGERTGRTDLPAEAATALHRAHRAYIEAGINHGPAKVVEAALGVIRSRLGPNTIL